MAKTGKRSPLAPTSTTATPNDMKFDDVSSAEVYSAGLRARHNSIGTNADASLGARYPRGKSSTTAASAQFRITASHTPYTEPEAPGTMASARLLPAVMGKQFGNFQQDVQFSTEQ